MGNIKISELPSTASLDVNANFLVENIVGGIPVTQKIKKSDFVASVTGPTGPAGPQGPAGQGVYDAVVSADGTRDYTTIDAALAAGKTILAIMAGSYTLSGNNTITNKDLVLDGFGKVNVTVTRSGTETNVFYAYNTTEPAGLQTVIRNVRFKGIDFLISSTSSSYYTFLQFGNAATGYPLFDYRMEGCTITTTTTTALNYYIENNLAGYYNLRGFCNNNSYTLTDSGAGQSFTLNTFYSSSGSAFVEYDNCNFTSYTQYATGAWASRFDSGNSTVIRNSLITVHGGSTGAGRVRNYGYRENNIVMGTHARLIQASDLIGCKIYLDSVSASFYDANYPYGAGMPTWAGSTAYTQNTSWVLYGGSVYKCLVNHTSTGDFYADYGNGDWIEFTAPIALNIGGGACVNNLFQPNYTYSVYFIFGFDGYWKYTNATALSGNQFNYGREMILLNNGINFTNNSIQFNDSSNAVQFVINNNYNQVAANRFISHFNGSGTARIAPRGDYNNISTNFWGDDGTTPTYTAIGSPTGNTNTNNLFYNW